jgi:NAD(P)-dependent dehydrogenase (short-subunit alcohol dehydrogenase family)
MLICLINIVVEYASKGIRINNLCPSFVWTPMVEKELKKDPTSLKFVEAVVPIKRMAEAEEVGDTAVWLCGPQSTYINGVSLMVDAGALLSVRVS